MSLRQQLLRSFVLQGAGSASVLFATLLLGANLGPEVQGGFNRTKAEIEFIAALAMFGLPHSLFFHLKSNRMRFGAALRWVGWTSLLAFPIGAALAWARPALPSGMLAMVALGAAVAAAVAHGQLRLLLLVRERTEWFNMVTALPQLLLLATVIALIVSGATPVVLTALAWRVVFALAFAAAAVLAWRRLRGAADTPVTEPVAGWRDLGRYGLATWLVSVMSTAALLAMQGWVGVSEGAAALGRFTLALTLVQVPLTPVIYAAPLLFRRWMEQPDSRRAHRWAASLFAVLMAGAALVWGLASEWPDLGLGAAYAGATRALAVLLAGGAAEAASRMLSTRAIAHGRPWIGVRAEAARLAVLAAGWLTPLPQGLLPLCVVWAVAAWAAALVFTAHRNAGTSQALENPQ